MSSVPSSSEPATKESSSKSTNESANRSTNESGSKSTTEPVFKPTMQIKIEPGLESETTIQPEIQPAIQPPAKIPDYPVITLDRRSLSCMIPGKSWNDGSQPVNSISYDKLGKKIIISTDDDSIYLYNLGTGQRSKSVNSKKYGASHVQFASAATCAIHSSTKVDHTIRLLSLADNKYIRYFHGHTDLVTGLSMSPTDDQFLSVSRDKTIRFWDLRSFVCTAIMTIPSNSVAAFDSEGSVFAAGVDHKNLKLYDIRNFEKGPFADFRVPYERSNLSWSSLKFSPCGKYILVNTRNSRMLLVDAFTGALKSTIEGHQNNRKISLTASFSPDSKYLSCGSSDRKIYTWATEDGSLTHTHSTNHHQTPTIVEWNPVYLSFISSDNRVTLWNPNPKTINKIKTEPEPVVKTEPVDIKPDIRSSSHHHKSSSSSSHDKRSSENKSSSGSGSKTTSDSKRSEGRSDNRDRRFNDSKHSSSSSKSRYSQESSRVTKSSSDSKSGSSSKEKRESRYSSESKHIRSNKKL